MLNVCLNYRKLPTETISEKGKGGIKIEMDYELFSTF